MKINESLCLLIMYDGLGKRMKESFLHRPTILLHNEDNWIHDQNNAYWAKMPKFIIQHKECMSQSKVYWKKDILKFHWHASSDPCLREQCCFLQLEPAYRGAQILHSVSVKLHCPHGKSICVSYSKTFLYITYVYRLIHESGHFHISSCESIWVW